MNRDTENGGAVLESSFGRVLELQRKTGAACCFISGYRKTSGRAANDEQSGLLEQTIRDAGFSFIKASGSVAADEEKSDFPVEDAFCIINNIYVDDDFIRLVCKWCKDFGQSFVLVTIPVEYCTRKHAGYSGQARVVGRYYDASGKVGREFEDASLSDIDEYFTLVYGEGFALTDGTEPSSELFSRAGGVYGRMSAQREFSERYPELADRSGL